MTPNPAIRTLPHRGFHHCPSSPTPHCPARPTHVQGDTACRSVPSRSRPIRRPEKTWRMGSAEAVFFGVIWPRQAVLIPSHQLVLVTGATDSNLLDPSQTVLEYWTGCLKLRVLGRYRGEGEGLDGAASAEARPTGGGMHSSTSHIPSVWQLAAVASM